MDVLLRTTEKLALDWPDEPRESRASKLDERFLIGAHSKPERRKLPFFSDLHRLISSSWKQPFSSVLTNAAAADFTNLVGSVEQGYTAMPVIEETLASHLSPSLAPSWKSRPLLPSKPCRPLLPLSGSPTSRPVRQVWPFTQWPSFRPTRRTSWRRWTKGPAWLLKPWRSYEEKPRPRALPPLRFGEPVAGLLPANNHASGLTWSGPTSLPLLLIRVVPDLWVGMRRDVLPLRGEARPRKRFCPPRTRSPHLNLSQPLFEAWCADLVHPHFYSGWQLGGRVRLSPFAARPFAAGEPHVWRHSCFSPAVYGTRAGHPSAQHFSLHHPEQGRRGLSFTVEGAAASRPSRHPISGMSSLTRHSDSSVALPSRMGASTRGITVGSPHNSNRLHSSVWKKSPRFDGVHLTVVNSASKASVLQQELSSLLQKGAIEEVPQSEVERGFFSHYFLVPKRDGGLRPILDIRRLNFSLYKGKFKMLTMRTIMSQVQEGDWFVTIDLKDAYFHIQVVQRHRRFLRFAFWREGLPIQGPALRPGFGAEDVYQMHGCCTGPFEAPGHSCTELSGRLAHSGSLQGASESSQGYRSGPHPFSWPQDERQEECAPPISANCVSRSSFGFRSDAGPFGSCPDTSSYSMSGPLQARPSCLCRYLPQAVGPHGSSLHCVAPRAASHEAIPLVDEGAEVTPHCTSYSPYQGVAQLLLTPFNVARPSSFSRAGWEWVRSPWGAVFEGRPASGEWKEEFLSWHINCLELRAVFLALKYFLPVLGGYHIIVRTDNMAVVSHINRQGGSRSRTLDRLARRLLLWSQVSRRLWA